MTFEENVKAVLETNFAGMKDELIDNATRLIVALHPSDTPTEWLHRYDDFCDWVVCPRCGYGSEGEVQIKTMEDVPNIYCPRCGQRLEGVK